MQYIDNTQKEASCKPIIDEFLAKFAATIPHTARYSNGFDKTPYKNLLKTELLLVQKGYCCYCMRELQDISTGTIEHVMQRSIDEQNLEQYKNKYPYFQNTIHLKPFEATWKYPPYPHSISYENLSVSCNGILGDNSSRLCCNNYRGSTEIVPLMHLANIAKIIEYYRSGIVSDSTNNADITKTVRDLNLNHKTLVEVRMLWYLVAQEKNTNNKSLLSIIINILFRVKIPNLHKYYINPTYHNIFRDYGWFVNYYQNI